jgi:hypothetical protein
MAAAAPSAPFSLARPLTEQALLAKSFRVLGDTTRVRILELLDERGELAVGQLAALLGESQPKVVRRHDGRQSATPPEAWIRAALSLPEAA